MKTTGSLVESKKKCRCEEVRRVGCWMWPLVSAWFIPRKPSSLPPGVRLMPTGWSGGRFLFYFFLFFPPFLTFQFPLTLSSFSLFQFSLFFPPFSRPYSHCPFFQMIKPNWGKKNKWNKTKLFPFLGSLWNSLSNITSRGWNLQPRYVHLDELATWDPEYWVDFWPFRFRTLAYSSVECWPAPIASFDRRKRKIGWPRDLTIQL